MFLPWFGGSLTGTAGAVNVPTRTGWEAFGGVLDFVIIAAAVTPIAIALARAADRLPQLPAEAGLLVLAAGVIAFVIVAVRLIDPPDAFAVAVPGVDADTSRKIASFVALACAAGIAYAGHLHHRGTRSG
jgi:hypothetical protein